LVELLRLQQVTSGHVFTDAGELQTVSTAKEELLAETLEDLPQEEPVVVFCRFVEDLRRVRRVAERQGRRYAQLSGSDHGGLRVWQDGEADVLGVQIQSGGVGIDLTKSGERPCRYAVYYSQGFSLLDYEQSLSRVHRPGQTSPVVYYHLVCLVDEAERSIDELVYENLSRKREVIEGVLERGALARS
jgi:SNF2 family DNA or RNA helicase